MVGKVASDQELTNEQLHEHCAAFKRALPDIIEFAVQVTDMGRKVVGKHIYFSMANAPKFPQDAIISVVTQIKPPAGAKFFPQPNELEPGQESKSHTRVNCKLHNLCKHYLRQRHMSGFQHRLETRTMEGDWGGSFIIFINGCAVAIALSGLTEKLCEAVLLIACIVLGYLTEEKAREFSRPLPPQGVQHGHGRRYYDQFYKKVWSAWQALDGQSLD